MSLKHKTKSNAHAKYPWGPSQKVAVVVDGETLYHNLKKKGLKVDYNALLVFVVDHRSLTQKPHLVVPITSTWTRFKEKVERLGYNVLGVAPKVLPDGRLKSRTDGPINRSIAEFAHNGCTTIVFVGGDSDFEQMLRYAKEECGKRIEIVGYREDVAHELKKLADCVRYLSIDITLKKRNSFPAQFDQERRQIEKKVKQWHETTGYPVRISNAHHRHNEKGNNA